MDGIVCADCKAQLWDAKASDALKDWKRDICKRKDIRNKMRVENVQVTAQALTLLQGIQDKTWVCDSRSISAVLAFYLAHYPEQGSDSLEKNLQNITVPGPRVHTYKTVRLSTQSFLRLNTIANLFQLEMKVIVEEVVNRMAAYMVSLDSGKKLDIKRHMQRDLEMLASV